MAIANLSKCRLPTTKPKWLFAAWCASIAVALLGGEHLWPVAAKIVEAIICVGALLLVASYPPIRSQFRQLPKYSRLFVCVLFCLLIAGQLSGRRWATYPISNWSMYSRAQTTSEFKYLRLEARLSDGSLIELRPTDLVPSLDHDRFRTKLIQLTRAAMNQAGPDLESTELHRTLAGLAELYNGQHGANSIRDARLYLYEIDIATYRANQPVERRLVAQVRTEAE